MNKRVIKDPSGLVHILLSDQNHDQNSNSSISEDIKKHRSKLKNSSKNSRYLKNLRNEVEENGRIEREILLLNQCAL